MIVSIFVRTRPRVSLYWISCSKPEDAADQLVQVDVRFQAQKFPKTDMIISLHFGQSQSSPVSHTVVVML